jgi:hypothetical protein
MCEHVHVRVYKCRNVGLSGIQSVRYQNLKRLTMPGTVRYQTKPMKSGIFSVRYTALKLYTVCQNADAGVNLLNADAGVNLLTADAQL